jgi:hypothetical protein
MRNAYYPSSKSFRIIEISLWVGAFCFLFIAPWYLGSLSPVKGESYSFGFNNKVAVFGFVIVIAIITSLKIWLLNPSISPSLLNWFNKEEFLLPRYNEAKGEYIVLSVSALFMFIATLWWNTFLVFPYWGGEISYFLGRIDLIALGFKPYQDFQYNYGPALLYIPLWLNRICNGILGIEDTYALCVASSYFPGFLCVFIFLRAMRIPKKIRPVILFLSLSMWMYISLGLNCSPLRFSVLPASLILFNRSRNLSLGSLPKWLSIGFFAAFFVSACFLISPEMGIAASVGLFAYAFLDFFSNRRKRALGIFGGILLCNLFFLFYFQGYLFAVFAFSSGGNNFPIYANAHNLLLFISVLIVIPTLLSSAWISRFEDLAPLAGAIGSSSLILLPAAYGRCDPSHVAFNGFMIIAMIFAASNYYGRGFLFGWGWLFAIVIIFMGQISYWQHGYAALFQQAFEFQKFYKMNPAVVDEWRRQWIMQSSTSSHGNVLHWEKTPPFPSGLEDLVSKNTIGIPFGADIGIERLLKLQKNYKIIYHQSPNPDWASPIDIKRSENESLRFDMILIPVSVIEQANGELDASGYRKGVCEFLSKLLLFPVDSNIKNPPYIPEVDLARCLLKKCEPVGKIPGYIFLRPITQVK